MNEGIHILREDDLENKGFLYSFLFSGTSVGVQKMAKSI